MQLFECAGMPLRTRQHFAATFGRGLTCTAAQPLEHCFPIQSSRNSLTGLQPRFLLFHFVTSAAWGDGAFVCAGDDFASRCTSIDPFTYAPSSIIIRWLLL